MNTLPPPSSRLARIPSARAVLAMALALVSLPATVRAQADGAPREAGSRWGVGAGAGSIQQPYRGIDSRTVAFPFVSYENRWLAVAGPGLDVKLPPAGSLHVRFRLRYGFDGYDAADSTFLAGMRDRKDAVWAGAAASWRHDIANVSVEVLTDARGDSNGSRAKALVDRRFALGAVGVTPRLGVEWLNGDYVDYYFGVTAAEARADRPQYAGTSALNADIGVRLDFAPAARQTVFLDLGYTRFDDGVRDSPIVGRSQQRNLAIGYVYRFGGRP